MNGIKSQMLRIPAHRISEDNAGLFVVISPMIVLFSWFESFLTE